MEERNNIFLTLYFPNRSPLVFVLTKPLLSRSQKTFSKNLKLFSQNPLTKRILCAIL